MSNHKPFDPTRPVVVSSPVPAPKLNATQHGCCAASNLILPGESMEQFKALETSWRKTYAPQNATEANLIDQLVTNDWLLLRSIRTLVHIESQLFEAEPNPLNWTDEQHKILTRFQRYRTANQNAVAKCRKAIEDHRRNRAAEKRTEEKHSILKERHSIYREKNKPEPNFDETIATMRKQAIALGFHPPKL